MLTIALFTVAQAMPLEDLRPLREGANAPALEASVYDRATAGETVTGIAFVDGVAAGRAWGVTVMDLDVVSVWMAINDNDGYVGQLANLTASQVIAGPAHGHGRLLFQRMDVPVVRDRWWVVRESHNGELFRASEGAAWEVSWRSVAQPSLDGDVAALTAGGQSVEWTEGAWLLVPLGPDRTLVEYYAWSDPGGSLPAGPASRFATGAVSSLLSDMEAFARGKRTASRVGYVRPDQTPL